MKQLNGMDEIAAYVHELLTTKENGKFLLARIYVMAQQYQTEQNEKKKIEELLNISPTERVVNTTLVSSDIAIAEVDWRYKGEKRTYFQAVVNGKRCFDVAEYFDQALLIALSQKYGVSSFATPAMIQILKMEEYQQKQQATAKPRTFLDLVIAGEKTVEDIEDAIDEWHNNSSTTLPLHEYLGLTEAEYEAWVQNDHVLPIIVDSIKSRMTS